ncbi:DUF3105 domain-containing protein [Streptomyces sp. NPDC089919]|uniref:DUF3105 domain-containing protein n=1 Tax=Streptomyces sp. NPDC089919 TaxID=3155188 RepID=UPI00342DC9DE
MATKAPKNSRNADHADGSRQARIAEMRRAEASRERRNKILVISLSVLLVAGIGGAGAYLVTKEKDKKDEAQVITGEKSWDPKTLGRKHVTTPVTYKMTPPVGGDHNPVWMDCNGAVYKKPVRNENAVHSLEHGAVWVTYTGKAAKGDVEKLAAKVARTPYTLMSPDDAQAGPIMLSAWGKQLTVTSASDPLVDKFFTKYVQGPQTPEPGAACTGGVAGE